MSPIKSFHERLSIKLLIVLFAAACLLSWRASEPWIHSNDSNGPMHSVFAKNYLKFGYRGTLLGQRMSPRVWEENLDSPALLRYYVDHPPLVPLLVSFSFRLFGVSEASTRLVAIIFSLLSLVLVYRIAYKLFDDVTAILSIILMTLLPIFLFFGRMANHEVVTNFFVLATIYSYLLWIESENAKYFSLIMLFLILGMCAGWPAYYLSGLLTVHYLIFVRERGERGVPVALLFPALAVAMFVLFLMQIFLLEKMEGLNSLIDKFLMRSGGGFSWAEFLVTLARYFDYAFTPLILCLALFYVATSQGLYRSSDTAFWPTHSILLVMFGLAITHVVVFKQGALEHPYWIFYFAPPVVICAARAVYLLAQNPVTRCAKVFALGVYGLFLLLLVWLSFPRTTYFYAPNRVKSYHLGQSINQQSHAGDVIVTPLRYQGTQLPYYADRDIRYGIVAVTELQRILANQRVNYRYYVVPEGQMLDETLQNYLRTHYVATASEGHMFFDLHSHRR